MQTDTTPSQAGAELAPETPEAAPVTAETPEAEPQVEEAKAPAAEEQPAAEVEAQEPDAEAEPAKKPKTTAAERIAQITAKRREAEREAQTLKDQNDRLQERLAKYETTEPKLEDFEYDENRYQAALSAHHQRQLRKEELAEDAEFAKQRMDNASQQATQAKQEAFQLRAAEFAQTAPDFQQVVSSANIPISDEVGAQLMDSDQGPQIAYYLAKNPGEAANIAHLTDPVQAAKEIGRLEARLSQPLPKRTTQAPPPVKAVAGNTGAVPDFDPSSASVDDYAKQLKKAGVI